MQYLRKKMSRADRNIIEKKTFEIFEIPANGRSLSHFRSTKKCVGSVKTTALAHHYYFYSAHKGLALSRNSFKQKIETQMLVK